MDKTQHTPGEWTPREGNSSGMEVVGKKPRGGDYIIARCGGKDREANARLIAAAPDMLKALKRLVEWNGKRGFKSPLAPDELLPSDEQSVEIAEGMAAIAKAEGSTNA